MHGMLPAQPQRSLFPGDSSVTEKSSGDSSVTAVGRKWFSALCDALWTSKAAAALVSLTSAKLHQCYRYVSGRQEPPGLLVVELLRSRDGERVLDQIMRGSREPWWQRLQLARAALPIVEQLRQLELPLE